MDRWSKGYESLFRRLRGSQRGIDMGLDDSFEAILANAQRLADAVIANNDDWSEGRAFAYALRASLRKYHDAKMHMETPK